MDPQVGPDHAGPMDRISCLAKPAHKSLSLRPEIFLNHVSLRFTTTTTIN